MAVPLRSRIHLVDCTCLYYLAKKEECGALIEFIRAMR